MNDYLANSLPGIAELSYLVYALFALNIILIGAVVFLGYKCVALQKKVPPEEADD